jgi:hypothetical protein
MREFNPQGLEALSVEDAIAYLKTNPADIILESAAFLPEAD